MSTTRIQLALNVEDIAEATAFYERLFGVPRTSSATATPTSWSRTRR
jgi:predicted enzyme related to lactoylglutathione lyase